MPKYRDVKFLYHLDGYDYFEGWYWERPSTSNASGGWILETWSEPAPEPKAEK